MEKYFDLNERGFSIRCKLYAEKVQAVKRVVIFCHGFGGHRDNRAAARFAEQTVSRYRDVGVVTFDWPAHGSDARSRLVLADCDAYLDLVIDYARRTFSADALYCYATSFGGYLVLKYLRGHGCPFRRIALRCPAIAMHRVIQGLMTDDDRHRIAKGKDALLGFDRKVKVGRAFLDELEQADITQADFMDFADNLLILHGTADEVVPYRDSAEFCDRNVIELISVDGVDHRFRDPKKLDLAHQDILHFFDL